MRRATTKPRKTLEGFGDHRSADTWARIAGIPRSTFYRYIKEGRTVEDIFKLHGLTYVSENPAVETRKPRYGKRMAESQQTMYALLLVSGYIRSEGPEVVDVRLLNKNSKHAINFNGKPFGVYNYKSGELLLSSGEGIPLNKIDPEVVRVLRNSRGKWELHPDTRKHMVLKFMEEHSKG